jgi:putative YphP/YqiW family bacilliredoxin
MFGINIKRQPLYDPDAVQWMRDELLYTGFIEMKTVKEVDEYLLDKDKETVLVFINSVCGCAAGSARPGINLALQNDVIPDYITTVFAGQDRDAVDRIREIITKFSPSSPSAALFRNGELVYMMQRMDIEGNSPEYIADTLINIFNQHCTRKGPSISKEDYLKLEYAKACGSTIPKLKNS